MAAGTTYKQCSCRDDHGRRLGQKCAKLRRANNAIAAVLPGATWQCCRTHAMRNLLTRVPKSAQAMVATLVRTVFAQSDATQVHAQFARVVDQLEGQFPTAAEFLIETEADLLAFSTFPVEHWRQIWSNNNQERLNK